VTASRFSMKRKLTAALTLLALLSGPLLAQDAGGATAVKSDSIFQSILAGGPLAVLIWCAILATSVTMVTFVIQNMLTLRRETMAPRALIDSLWNEISAGNYQAAWETCDGNNNYLANVFKAALERVGRGKTAVEDAFSDHALREATGLRTRNSYLSVIGVISPMIGLLGTVIGMMKAFQVLGAGGIGDVRGLASSISEVLLATAAGLFIAIPAFLFYYIFRNKAQMVIVYADDQIGRLLEDIPYEELEGLRIGEFFNAGQPGGAPGGAESRRVSMVLTTNCPVCNGAVTPGENPCPHCGATLDWAA
jgi:biopolymer transport protein ExbB